MSASCPYAAARRLSARRLHRDRAHHDECRAGHERFGRHASAFVRAEQHRVADRPAAEHHDGEVGAVESHARRRRPYDSVRRQRLDLGRRAVPRVHRRACRSETARHVPAHYSRADQTDFH
jgi:hypothetical protein